MKVLSSLLAVALLAVLATWLWPISAEAVEECQDLPPNFGYEVFVGPWSDMVDALAVIHSGPDYEYISGPTKSPGAGCYAIFYRGSAGQEATKPAPRLQR